MLLMLKYKLREISLFTCPKGYKAHEDTDLKQVYNIYNKYLQCETFMIENQFYIWTSTRDLSTYHIGKA